ncbi:hypothetical protein D3C74_85680 [compost metagenome]
MRIEEILYRYPSAFAKREFPEALIYLRYFNELILSKSRLYLKFLYFIFKLFGFNGNITIGIRWCKLK